MPYAIVAGDDKNAARLRVRVAHAVEWTKASHDPRSDTFHLPPKHAIVTLHDELYRRLRLEPRPSPTTPPTARIRLVYIQRAAASKRRISNDNELQLLLQNVCNENSNCEVRLFSDAAPRLDFAETMRLFAGAHIVLGAHGAGLANAVACGAGAVLVELALPEEHAQYAAHLSAALALRYARVPLPFGALHSRAEFTLTPSALVHVEMALHAALAVFANENADQRQNKDEL